MTEESFNETFDWIEKFHGKRGALDPQVRLEWFVELGRECDDEVFFEAAHLATDRMPPGLFPSKERMRQFITEAREKLWQRIKAAAPRAPLSQPEFPPDQRGAERGIKWLAGILDVVHGKRTAENLIAEMNGQDVGENKT